MPSHPSERNMKMFPKLVWPLVPNLLLTSYAKPFDEAPIDLMCNNISDWSCQIVVAKSIFNLLVKIDETRYVWSLWQ